jgi:hypothetical protein
MLDLGETPAHALVRRNRDDALLKRERAEPT